MTSTYAASEIQRLLERGPQPDEGFYRVKITGNGETKWFNVTGSELETFARLLDETA